MIWKSAGNRHSPSPYQRDLISNAIHGYCDHHDWTLCRSQSNKVELIVRTTYFIAPCSSLVGVQCVKNLSSERDVVRDRIVSKLILAEMAWPLFKAVFTLFLNSLGIDVVCCARNLKTSAPRKSWLFLAEIPNASTMPSEKCCIV